MSGSFHLIHNLRSLISSTIYENIIFLKNVRLDISTVSVDFFQNREKRRPVPFFQNHSFKKMNRPNQIYKCQFKTGLCIAIIIYLMLVLHLLGLFQRLRKRHLCQPRMTQQKQLLQVVPISLIGYYSSMKQTLPV